MFSVGISEIVLLVDDVPSAARFYRDVVGLTPDASESSSNKTHAEWAWFWAGEPGQLQRLALLKSSLAPERFLLEDLPGRPHQPRWGRVHLALRVPRHKVVQAVEHVRAAGVAVDGPVRFDWMKADAYYFYDPDGNLLEWWSPDPSR